MAKTKEAPVTTGDDVNIGDQVQHAKWGVGTVMFKSGSGETTKIVVIFPEEGQKKLMIRYAKLVRVGAVSKTMAARIKAGKPMTPDPAEEKSAPAAQEDTVVAPGKSGDPKASGDSDDSKAKAPAKGGKKKSAAKST